MGLHRIISSTSIAIRFRNSIVVGTMKFSASEMVGNTTAVPPGRGDSPLHRLGQVAQSHVAGIELTPTRTDPDDRTAAHRLSAQSSGPEKRPFDRATHITGEVITVDRRPASGRGVPWTAAAQSCSLFFHLVCHLLHSSIVDVRVMHHVVPIRGQSPHCPPRK
jgi:hypothetical protein